MMKTHQSSKKPLNNVPKTWKKRVLKLSLTLIIPLLLLYLLIAIVPYFIKPGITDVAINKIQAIWQISSIIQYVIYAALAFYFYPKMGTKKALDINTELEHIQNALESRQIDTFTDHEYYELTVDKDKYIRKLRTINRLTSIKAQWIVMFFFIVFDVVAGQLPYYLLIAQ